MMSAVTIVVSGVLLVLGIIFIYLNTLSKQKQGDECNVCGTKLLGKKCPKCGYENYQKDDFKSNSFMSIMGVIFIIAAVGLFICYQNKINIFESSNSKQSNNVTPRENRDVISNQNTNTNSNDVNENVVINPDVNESINTTNNNTSQNVTTNTNTHTNTNTNTSGKKLSVVTSGVGKIINGCRINTFTASFRTINDVIELDYTVNITNNSASNGICNFNLVLLDENGKQVDNWLSFKFVDVGSTETLKSFKFVNVSKAKYTLSIN